MDCSLPGSSVHGIFQARVLEWGAIALVSSRDTIFTTVSLKNTCQLLQSNSEMSQVLSTLWYTELDCFKVWEVFDVAKSAQWALSPVAMWSSKVTLAVVVFCQSSPSCQSTLACVHAQSLQSCLTLWDSMDCSPSGSSVHGILQARILEWVARPSSRGSSWPGDPAGVSYVSSISRWVLYH